MTIFERALVLATGIQIGQLNPGKLRDENGMGDTDFTTMDTKCTATLNRFTEYIPKMADILAGKSADNTLSDLREFFGLFDRGIGMKENIFKIETKPELIQEIKNKAPRFPIHENLMSQMQGPEPTRFEDAFNSWMNSVLSSPAIDIKLDDEALRNKIFDALMASGSYNEIICLQMHASDLRDKATSSSKSITGTNQEVTKAYDSFTKTSQDKIKEILIKQLSACFRNELTQNDIELLKKVLISLKKSESGFFSSSVALPQVLKSKLINISNDFHDGQSLNSFFFRNAEMQSHILIANGVIEFWIYVIRALDIQVTDITFNKDSIDLECKDLLSNSEIAPDSNLMKYYREDLKDSLLKYFNASENQNKNDLLDLKNSFFGHIRWQFMQNIMEISRNDFKNKIRDEVIGKISSDRVTQLLSIVESKFQDAFNKNIKDNIKIDTIIENLTEKTYINFQKVVKAKLDDPTNKNMWIHNAEPYAFDYVSGSSVHVLLPFITGLNSRQFVDMCRQCLQTAYNSSSQVTILNALGAACVEALGLAPIEFQTFDTLFPVQAPNNIFVENCILQLKEQDYRAYKESLKNFLKLKFDQNKQLEVLKKCSDRQFADEFKESKFNAALKAFKSKSENPNSKDNEDSAWWKWMLGGILLILVGGSSIYFLHKYKLADQ